LQSILSTRLDQPAATRLALEPERVLAISFDSGFRDVSNFNHAFRAAFGVNPRLCRNYARRKSREMERRTAQVKNDVADESEPRKG